MVIKHVPTGVAYKWLVRKSGLQCVPHRAATSPPPSGVYYQPRQTPASAEPAWHPPPTPNTYTPTWFMNSLSLGVYPISPQAHIKLHTSPALDAWMCFRACL
eukprot:GHUV01048473.1.p1 GENE.GHUV01048473.1~~GHUV01048473.1.p1  ORF type:complete len:102 (-),score=1.74 GHUV01048473.1:672-977(-)